MVGCWCVYDGEEKDPPRGAGDGCAQNDNWEGEWVYYIAKPESIDSI